jgi:hypothetical protein
MRRDQLEHAIRTARQIIGKPEVIVVGSQSILGTFREDQLPADATMSVESTSFPSPTTTPRRSASPTSSKASPGSSHRSRNSTGTASTASTSAPPPCRRAGAAHLSKSRTPIPRHQTASLSTQAGALTRKTCASPSSAPSGKGPELRRRARALRTRRPRDQILCRVLSAAPCTSRTNGDERWKCLRWSCYRVMSK